MSDTGQNSDYQATGRLVFASPPSSGRLLFGLRDDGSAQIPAAELELDAELPELECESLISYRSAAQRPVVGLAANPWQLACELQSVSTADYMQDAQCLPVEHVALHQAALSVMTGAEHLLPDVAKPLDVATSSRQQDAISLASWGRFAAQDGIRTDIERGAQWQSAQTIMRGTGLRYQDGLRDRRIERSTHWQLAREQQVSLWVGFGVGKRALVGWAARSQIAIQPRPGISRPVVPQQPEEPEVDPCYIPSGKLVFRDIASFGGRLVFICERHEPGVGALVVVPVLRTYIVQNSITLHRVDTGAELHALDFEMALDASSWTWRWSASLHSSAAPHLGREASGDPAELHVEVNGVPFRLRMYEPGRDERFLPGERYQVTGEGKAAILGAPWSPEQSFSNEIAMTAQQLALNVLTVNGVPMGWNLDWQLQDWTLPARAWAMQGTYIDAITDIAAAAGGYVQPHNTEQVLRVLHRYPHAPWQWDSVTPDFQIPRAAAEVVGTRYMDKPKYNQVFVSGMGVGCSGPVRRAGTQGGLLAPQALHALITDPLAHIQRGRAVLSDTGRQDWITLQMQVRPETGIIMPGQFVRYMGAQPVMGIVRSTSISWGRPKLRQTIQLETHHV